MGQRMSSRDSGLAEPCAPGCGFSCPLVPSDPRVSGALGLAGTGAFLTGDSLSRSWLPKARESGRYPSWAGAGSGGSWGPVTRGPVSGPPAWPGSRRAPASDQEGRCGTLSHLNCREPEAALILCPVLKRPRGAVTHTSGLARPSRCWPASSDAQTPPASHLCLPESLGSCPGHRAGPAGARVWGQGTFEFQRRGLSAGCSPRQGVGCPLLALCVAGSRPGDREHRAFLPRGSRGQGSAPSAPREDEPSPLHHPGHRGLSSCCLL